MRSVSKIDIMDVAYHENRQYTEAVIRDLIDIIYRQRAVVNSVLNLNPNVESIGAGRLANLIEMAREACWDSNG